MNRIVIFRSDLLPRSETFIKEQAKFLVDWRPVLVGYGRVADGLDLGDLEVRVIPSVAAKSIGRYALRSHHLFDRPHSASVATLQGANASLVHAHFGTDATDIWPSVRAAGLPMLVTLHGYDINIHPEWWQAGHGGLYRRLYPKRLLRMAREPAVNFLAVSQAIKRRAIEYGIPEDKITVSYIGVDTERFKPGGLPIEQRRKRILFVGRMVEKKAPLLLICAFSDVLKHVPDAELVMIGDGPLLSDAKDLARTLSLPVEFMGAQDSVAVLQELHRARVFCLPSVTAPNGDAEGFGLVMLEAQASGVPVITSANGGAAEGVLDGKSGATFAEGDAPAMIAALRRFLESDSCAVCASSAALRHARQDFDLRTRTRELERIYHTTSAARPR